MPNRRGNYLSYIYEMLHNILKVVIVIAIITFFPGFLPDMTFTHYKLKTVPIALNGKLNNAEKLFLNEVKGPEDVVVYNNELYTSTHGGYIKKISKGKLIPLYKFGRDCNEQDIVEEDICGRPLGFRFDGNGLLYVADAYYGIKKVNLSTGDIKTIIPNDEPIDGLKPLIPNSIAISRKTRAIYWSDSSTTHTLKDGLYTLLGNGNGRLIKYDRDTQENEVLMKNLHFANGVALPDDESFVVVAETFRSRLLKYNLKGPKAGKIEVFSELPGFPDNVDYKNGKFIVSIVMIPDDIVKFLPEWPLVRKFAARSLALIDHFTQELNNLYPNWFLKKLSHMVGHFESMNLIVPPSGVIVLIIDETGQIVETLSTTDKSISSISSMIPFNDYYYLGSPFNPYLARVKIV